MFRSYIDRLGAAALMIAAVSSSAPVAAQRPPPGRGVIAVPCCRCVDGSALTANASTGATPWRVTPPNGASALAVLVPANQIPTTWTSLPPARWVRHPTVQGVGNYLYELRVFVPNCIIPARVTLAGQFATDNGGSLQINSNPAINTHPVTGFASPVTVPATGLTAGMNTIRVRVKNLGGPTGFLLRATVTVRCPREQPTRVPPSEEGDRG